jgi:hypothetical protein
MKYAIRFWNGAGGPLYAAIEFAYRMARANGRAIRDM